ncbi:hypothetical protein SEVIR_4G135000v4 [Setaria viridis]|uniref:Uncharacterized protein n=2 Tax=Setaria TaxID=4554 RepID=K3Y3M8_SETIT|nr:uncharacterized protein LOC101757693 [Setaria italica]XP_034591996.1 uncharacterized protein LOC117853819 [Setaria viridis]RCV21809.1 hypothetical protein SETIT_4G167400v2 [Setaria italica]TKW21667.1 hypothetical protein SEVIR_4G135000v2 [Setaria viridis]
MATTDHEAAGYSSGARLLVWDCGSALYDSYELAAFTRQLDAAVLSCGRSLSMPHLTAATPPVPADAQLQGTGRRRRRRLPALLRRLFSKVLRLRLSSPGVARRAPYRMRDDGAGSPWSGALTSIPEEQSSSSPEIGSSPMEPGTRALRKTQSERFIGGKTAPSVLQFDVVL